MDGGGAAFKNKIKNDRVQMQAEKKSRGPMHLGEIRYSVAFEGDVETCHFVPIPSIKIDSEGVASIGEKPAACVENVHYAFLRPYDRRLRGRNLDYSVLLALEFKISREDVTGQKDRLHDRVMIVFKLAAENQMTFEIPRTSREDGKIYKGRLHRTDRDWLFGATRSGLILQAWPEELVHGIIEELPISPLAMLHALKMDRRNEFMRDIFPADGLKGGKADMNDPERRARDWMLNEKASDAWGGLIHAEVIKIMPVMDTKISYRNGVRELISRLPKPMAKRIAGRLTIRRGPRRQRTFPSRPVVTKPSLTVIEGAKQPTPLYSLAALAAQ